MRYFKLVASRIFLLSLSFLFVNMSIVEPKFLTSQATHLFMTEPVFFQVVQMSSAVFVWIGKTEGKLGDFSVAVPPFGSQVTNNKKGLYLLYLIRLSLYRHMRQLLACLIKV